MPRISAAFILTVANASHLDTYADALMHVQVVQDRKNRNLLHPPATLLHLQAFRPPDSDAQGGSGVCGRSSRYAGVLYTNGYVYHNLWIPLMLLELHKNDGGISCLFSGYQIESFDNPADFFMDITNGEAKSTYITGIIKLPL